MLNQNLGMNILRILNTLLLVLIFATLLLIFSRLAQPLKIDDPIRVEGWNGLLVRENQPEPVIVKIVQ